MPVITPTPQQPTSDMQVPEGKREKGTGFTNIGRILGANVGAGQRMGQAVGQSLGMQAGQVRAGAERSAQQFRSQAEQARERALGDIAGVGQLLGTPTTISPGLVGLTEEQAKTAGEKMRGAAYTGPKEVAGTQALSRRAAGLGEAGLYGYAGPVGQRQLLRQTVAAPGMYTRGQSVLDQILLGQDVAGQRAVRAGAQESIGAKQAVGGLLGGAQQTAKDIASEISKERERVGGEAIKQFGDIQKAAEEQARTFNEQTLRAQILLNNPKEFGMVDDPTQGKIYDPAKAEKDKQIMTNLSQRGVGTGVTIDPAQSDYLTSVLQSIASSGAISPGSPYYQGSQQQAAKNLALITGQKDIAEGIKNLQPFRTSQFSMGEEGIKGLQTYQDMLDVVPNKINENKQTQSLANTVLDEVINYSQSDARNSPRPPAMSFDEFQKAFTALTGKPLLGGGLDWYGYAIQQLSPIIQNLQKEEQNLQSQIASRSTLQDYLNKMYGVVPSAVTSTGGIKAGELPRISGPRQV